MATLISATSLRNELINRITGRTTGNISALNGSAYLALSSTEPSYNSSGDITGITEPSTAQGYKRKLIGHSTESSTLLMNVASNGSATNSAEIHFDQAKEEADGGTGWGDPIKYFAIYTAATGGTPILAGELSTEISVSAGYVVIIKAGELKIEMNMPVQSA